MTSYYRTQYECNQLVEDELNMHYGSVTGEHAVSTKVLCHIFDQQNKGLVKRWTTSAYEKPTSELLHVYGSVDRSKDILVFTQPGHEPLSRYLDRIELVQSPPNHNLLSTDFAKILRAILRMMKKVLNEPAYAEFSGSIKVENIFLVNEEPRLAIRSGLEKESMGIANFCTMVRDIWFKKLWSRKPPIELKDLLTSLGTATVDSKVFKNAVNHPSLLSSQERVLYRSRAYQQKLKAMNNSANVYATFPKHISRKWSTINLSRAQMNSSKGLEHTVAELAITYEENNQLVHYPDTAQGFLRFCRNLEVHMNRQLFTYDEADFDLMKFYPKFLLTLHKILTDEDIFIDPTPF